jgi:hypothetical protein
MNDVAVQRALASLDRLVNASEKDLWDYANVVAVILTLCFLVWYTIETFRLRREAQLQTSASRNRECRQRAGVEHSDNP